MICSRVEGSKNVMSMVADFVHRFLNNLSASRIEFEWRMVELVLSDFSSLAFGAIFEEP
jgi:hypothetical protein